MILVPDLERQLSDAADRLPPPEQQHGRSRLRSRSRPTLFKRAAILISVTVAGAVLAVSLLSSRSSVPSALAAKTFAAVNPTGAIVHFAFDVRSTIDGRPALHLRFERWQLGTSVRTITTTYDHGKPVVTQSDLDGKVSRVYLPAQRRVTSVPVGDARASTDPFLAFRERYRAGAVHDVGNDTFDGQAVRRLQVRAGQRRITYLVRPSSGVPVAVDVLERAPRRRGSSSPAAVVHRVTRVLRYERLAPTTANRRLLRLQLPVGTTVAKTPADPLQDDSQRTTPLSGSGTTKASGSVRWTPDAVAIRARDVPVGDHYAVWLEDTFLGFAAPVTAGGRLIAQAETTAPRGTLLITIEHTARPAYPGRVLLHAELR
jgi:hypothetical protein